MAEEVKVTSKSTNSVDILGLDDIKADLDVNLGLPQPLKTDSKTDSKASLELKPLKADLGTVPRALAYAGVDRRALIARLEAL